MRSSVWCNQKSMATSVGPEIFTRSPQWDPGSGFYVELHLVLLSKLGLLTQGLSTLERVQF